VMLECDGKTVDVIATDRERTARKSAARVSEPSIV
jgi:hypothetical protein